MSVLVAIRKELEDSRAELLRTAERASDAQLHVRPSEQQWSVAEILHHLLFVENRITDRVSAGIAAAREKGAPEPSDAEQYLRSIDHLQVQRVTTPIQSRTTPEAGHSRPDLLAGLAASRARLLEVIHGGVGFDLSVVSAPHPVFGELNLYQWLIFVARHEDRHRAQMERVLSVVPAE
jgi:uncharacterized damage-inducible protein DinB